MAALDHRRRTGEGQYIDQAQMESALYFLAPELLDAQVCGHRARCGNRDRRAPHDVYPVRRRRPVVRDRGRDRRGLAALGAVRRAGVGRDPARDAAGGRVPHAS